MEQPFRAAAALVRGAPISRVEARMRGNGTSGYNSHVRSVNIAELKDQLSSFLQRVRAGQELVIRDRNLPIARIVPLRGEEMELDELSLVATGQMTLPKKQFDEQQFWAIGGRAKRSQRLTEAIRRAVEGEREEDHASVLGHKRHRPHMRTRSKL